MQALWESWYRVCYPVPEESHIIASKIQIYKRILLKGHYD